MLFGKLHKLTILGVVVAFAATACTKKVDDKDTTLNIALKANVKGLDPIRASDLYSSTAIGQLFDADYLKEQVRSIFNYERVLHEIEDVYLQSQALKATLD